MKTITFFFAQDDMTVDGIQRKGLFDIPSELTKCGNRIEIPTETLKKSMNEAIEKVVEIIPLEEHLPNSFQVEEIEFALNVGVDGKVSVIALESAASISSSITVRLKRKSIT